MERRPAMKKISTVAKNGNEIFKEPKLTIGLDLGDRSSYYCILDEAGKGILEHRLPTTPRGDRQIFSTSAGDYPGEVEITAQLCDDSHPLSLAVRRGQHRQRRFD